MTTQPSKMEAQFGYTADGRKVHMGFAFDGLRCVGGDPITDVIATVPEGAGLTDMFRALTDAEVTPQQLCFRCFPIRTRKAYAVWRSGRGLERLRASRRDAT